MFLTYACRPMGEDIVRCGAESLDAGLEEMIVQVVGQTEMAFECSSDTETGSSRELQPELRRDRC